MWHRMDTQWLMQYPSPPPHTHESATPPVRVPPRETSRETLSLECNGNLTVGRDGKHLILGAHFLWVYKSIVRVDQRSQLLRLVLRQLLRVPLHRKQSRTKPHVRNNVRDACRLSRVVSSRLLPHEQTRTHQDRSTRAYASLSYHSNNTQPHTTTHTHYFRLSVLCSVPSSPPLHSLPTYRSINISSRSRIPMPRRKSPWDTGPTPGHSGPLVTDM